MNNNRSLITQTTGHKSLKASIVSMISIVSIALLSSCERRPLEVYYENLVTVKVELDWLDHFGMRPNGMVMLVYDENDTLIKQPTITNDVDMQMLDLTVGTYKLVFVNNPEENTTAFQRLGNHFESAMRAEELRGHNYQSWETMAYDQAPEDIGAAVDTIQITQDMVETHMRFIDYRERNSITSDTALYVFHEVPDPMTVTLFIKAKVKRWQSVKAIEANISGMADGFYISRIDRTEEKSTLLLDEWKMYRYGAEADSMGIITAEIASFGLPHGKELLSERDSTDNVLTFHFTLTDDEVQDCSFNVGKEIRYITPTGREAQIRNRQDLHDLKLELDLSETAIMPPKPPTRAGTGFDAEVAEWEEGGVIDMGGF